ncbi:MAG: hypothetical protein V4772_15860, partial [Pseudomonadota bacterium]
MLCRFDGGLSISTDLLFHCDVSAVLLGTAGFGPRVWPDNESTMKKTKLQIISGNKKATVFTVAFHVDFFLHFLLCIKKSGYLWCPGENSNLHILRYTDLN